MLLLCLGVVWFGLLGLGVLLGLCFCCGCCGFGVDLLSDKLWSCGLWFCSFVLLVWILDFGFGLFGWVVVWLTECWCWCTLCWYVLCLLGWVVVAGWFVVFDVLWAIGSLVVGFTVRFWLHWFVRPLSAGFDCLGYC